MNQLYTFQKETVEKILENFKKYNSIMLQMPTGTGKTIVFCSILKMFRDDFFDNRLNNNRRILVLVHRDHLLVQTKDTLFKKYGIKNIGIIKGQKVRNLHLTTQVAMVQTIVRNIKKGEFQKIPGNVSLIIVDEAHHSLAGSYKTILTHYKKLGAKLLGVTATPTRLDKSSFKDEFDFLVSSFSIKWFIENKFLSKYKHYATAQPNLNGIKEEKGDYEEKELAKRMSENNIMAEVIKSYLDYGKNGKAIIFAVNKKHSIEIVQRFNEREIKANYIDSDTSAYNREEIIKNFRNGSIRILCNVNIFTEGFDCPDIDLVILARPTKSVVLYLQMIERVLRIDHKNPDKTALILDNAMLWKHHGLISKERQWSLQGLKDLDEELEVSLDDNKEVKTKDKNRVEEDPNRPMEEIDKSQRTHITFKIELLQKNTLIHEEFVVTNQMLELKSVEERLLQLKDKIHFDELRIKADNDEFLIHNKIGRRKTWEEWKNDDFEYYLIQNNETKYVEKFNKNHLNSLNKKELPLSKVYDQIFESFRGKLAQNLRFNEIENCFTKLLPNQPFYVCLKSPYFKINFYTLKIPFPFDYFKEAVVLSTKRNENEIESKIAFESTYEQIKNWIEIIN